MSKVANKINENSLILQRPRITEKSAKLAENQMPVYVFEVASRANKNQVKSAIKSIYKVSPLKVNIVNLKPKAVFRRGKKGKTSGIKKAFVYLRKGDKIEFV